ncbi:hypothetical protein MNQ95_09085 [Pseudoxanthomonas daejeonensis]|uniref:hypothetical protein n=1 Tax=Pseudoxanthomonas daejeonensis TaxID=266062 RepID=UPI001F540B99|nr:hypothetical protein [Pseudoxanthomonas daejeonensis]UNK56329.1 hypothetical protein MNQ95_09085 [Pseudoxanthomonas daejeonensis]
MDLMRLLRSLEEFLYELVGWLVFYPRTFWRVLRHPGAMARYTRLELAQPPERQFEETISPVLMLILSVVLAHVAEMALKVSLPTMSTPVGQLLFGSEQFLLLTRSAVFCIYALGAALGTLRQDGSKVTRATLREPFSIQAFLACPFVVMFSIGEQLARTAEAREAGVVLACAAVVWYIVARAIAYRALYRSGWLKALALVIASFSLTTVLVLAAFALLLV